MQYSNVRIQASYWALSLAANKFQAIVDSESEAAQAIKEKIALKDQARTKDVAPHATKPLPPRKFAVYKNAFRARGQHAWIPTVVNVLGQQR